MLPYTVSIHRTSSCRGSGADPPRGRPAKGGTPGCASIPNRSRRRAAVIRGRTVGDLGRSCWSPGSLSAATLLGPALTTDFDFTNSPEAKRAQQILEERQLDRGRDHRDLRRRRRAGRDRGPGVRRPGERVPRPSSTDSGPTCSPALPAAFPLTEEAGGRSAGGGARPDPVRGRLRGAVHRGLRRRHRRGDAAFRGRRGGPRSGVARTGSRPTCWAR